MKQLKQESGRSMVEMLGVLAVIGVLSVGGIAGYTLAMNKHRANSVAADLMKRAVVVSAQRQLGQTPSLNGFNTQVGDYKTDNQVGIATDDKFSMTVQDVPQEVCEKILALDWDNATISPATAEGCDGGDMTFTYNNDLSPVTNNGSTGGEGTDTPPEQNCTGTGNGCQKCDENGNMVPDTAKDGQPCGNNANTVCSNGTCGCPNGGSLGEDGQTCCLDGYAYNGKSDCYGYPAEGYCGVNIPMCGCEASYSVLSATGKGCCAKGDYKYYDDGTNINGWSFGMNNVAECYGCGYGKLVEKDGQKYCCGGNSYAPGEAGPYDISYCSSDVGANGLPNCNSPASTAITQVCCEAVIGMQWCSGNNTCIEEYKSCPTSIGGSGDN